MKRILLAGLLIITKPAIALSDTICEAVTIHEEAEGESWQGKRAVLDVVRHRASALGKSSCQIVKQRGQFSFVHKKFKWRVTQDMLDSWQEADTMAAVVPDAWYFNSGKRIRKYEFIRRVGLHNFYRK